MSRISAMHEAMPVAKTKPIRGQEIISRKINTDKPEVYHEGYIDGKLFLVPDSNLEAMKDVVNLTMRPRKSTRYRHQTSYELADYDHFQDKLVKLLSKIDEVSVSSSEESKSTEKSSSEVEEEEKVSSKEESSESEEEEEEESPVEEEEEKIEEKPVLETVSAPVEEEIRKSDQQELESRRRSAIRIRFLISGHFKNGDVPMYIIHDYDGKLDLFKDQKADFVSVQKTGAAEVILCGRTYTENILFESQGRPDYLNIKPNKLYIRPETCKVFYDYFETVFPLEIADLTLKGEFIRTETINKITPLLSFGIRPKQPQSSKSSDQSNKQETTAYYVSKPKDIPFFRSSYVERKKKSFEKNSDIQNKEQNLEKSSSFLKKKFHLTKDIAKPPKSK